MPTPNPDRRIRLTPTFQAYLDDSVAGVRFTVVADSAALMPAEVFAYLQLPPQPAPGGGPAVSPGANFSHVSSPADLAEMPVGTPLPDAAIPWFRQASVDLVVRTRAEADATWTAILADVQTLKRTLDVMDDQAVAPAAWIDAPPPGP